MKNYNKETLLDEPNNTENSFSNKASFIIGFAALVIAFSPYKNLAEGMVVQLFGLSVSVYALAGIFLLILFASIYLYGLNYIRYDFPRLLSIKWLSYVEILGHLIYTLAFIFPFFILLVFLLSYLIKFIPSISPPTIELFVSAVSGVFMAASTYLSLRAYQNKKYELIKELQDSQNKFFEREEYYREDDLRMLVLNYYEEIITRIEALLVPQVGIAIKRIAPSNIVKLAWTKKFISSKQVNTINDLRRLRNQIAHNDIQGELNQEHVGELLQKGRKILEKLEKLEVTRKIGM